MCIRDRSRRAARRAGHVAATKPSRADRNRNATRLDVGTTVSVSLRDETRAMPIPVPMTMPMTAPKTDRTTDSERTMVRTWRRFMPTARRLSLIHI